MSGSIPTSRGLSAEGPLSRWAEGLVILGLFLFFLTSFRLSSQVNGPTEVFAQDSYYILEFLSEGDPYRWNPQNHILYHFVLELGHGPWKALFGDSVENTYRYLKLFTALNGLVFLIAMRWLLRTLRLGLIQRLLLLVLVSISVSTWFHFSAFETHCTAMPALAVYLGCLTRMRDGEGRSRLDRVLFVAALLVIGWTRIDLFRFAAATALLPLLPAVRCRWRSLVVDLAIVGALGFAGNTVLSRIYFGVPLGEATTTVLERYDRRSLRRRLGKLANLSPGNLVLVGRAVTLYSIVMPVEPADPRRSFFAPPTYDIDHVVWPDNGDRPSTGLFLQPARNLVSSALSLLAGLGCVALLAAALAASVGAICRGDALHTLLLAHAAAGWILYTWFNPVEPFLWVVEYVPIWIVMIAELLRGRDRRVWGVLALLVGLIALHNLYAFYLPLL